MILFYRRAVLLVYTHVSSPAPPPSNDSIFCLKQARMHPTWNDWATLQGKHLGRSFLFLMRTPRERFSSTTERKNYDQQSHNERGEGYLVIGG